MTPDSLPDNNAPRGESQEGFAKLAGKSGEDRHSSNPAAKRSSTATADTAPTEAETVTLGHSHSSTLASSSSTMGGLFYSTPSQRKLQEQLQHSRKQSGSASSSTTSQPSYLSGVFRLEEEQLDEGLQDAKIRQGIEHARRATASKWKTPYDIDLPHRVRLPSSRSLATTASSSTGLTSSEESDPLVMERQIWNGIEALMADAISDMGSVCTEDVLPKNLMRAMSSRSMSSSHVTPQSQLSPEEEDEIKMAQVALNSFMDMLLPSENHDSIPSLETVRGSEYATPEDRIELAEVALHNFMDVLLSDIEDDLRTSDHSSKVQILDLFQWSLKVNVDAQEKIKYMELERLRLEEERQRELQELLETERRLEEERARRRRDEEVRRHRIQKLEENLAQEQRALAAANKRAFRDFKRKQRPHEPSIPEEGEHQVDDMLWASTPGGKPLVVQGDGSIDPLPQVRKTRAKGELDLSDISSIESDADRGYIVTKPMGPSPTKVPAFDPEGTLLREAHVMRMPSWTMLDNRRIIMASPSSVDNLSEDSSISNQLPSSFHERDAIRTLSDSDSSRNGRRRTLSSSGSGLTSSNGSSLDMPDLTSIHEDSVLGSIETPPFIAKGESRSYRGGVPPPATLEVDASFRRRFSRVPSSGRNGLVSACGDVFIDDVSQYSFSKRFVDPVVREKRHTGIISVGSAGDIHQLVGSTVRFHENGSSSSSSSDSSESVESSDNEDITLDSQLHRDEQMDAKKSVPQVNTKYGKRRKFGGRIRSSIKVMRNRGKCVTNSWLCDRAGQKSTTKKSKQLKKLNSRVCLLHGEDSPYDRTHVLEESRLTIDDDGFVID